MSPVEKSENEVHSSKAEKVFQKVYNLLCCNDFCKELCDCCWEQRGTKKKKRITKDDIQHIVNHQPVTATLSDTSRSSISTSTSTQSYGCSNASLRDRLDSDNSSRKESISSSPEMRKPHVKPVIDMKPIEFWTANREAVQPRTPRRRLPSESDFSLDSFQLDLYESTDSSDEPQTDEEKLARYGLGQVHFSLQYEIPMKILKVKIIEAKELSRPYHQDTNKQDMAHSNPYVKVALLPDQKNSRQTTVKRKTQSPCWNETFAFELPYTEAQRRTLEITLKDFDKYSRHCVIGQVHLPLANINLVKGGHMWKPLLPCHMSQPDLGELLLSLNYLPSAGRLNVDIIKAQQLLQTDLVGGSDPFVKVSLLQHGKVLKTRKTSIKRNTIDPVFNESINFNLTPDMLDSISLVVTVWDYNSKSRDDFVGRIVLGKQATGAYEVTHWNRMMQCHRSPVAQWHTLRPREDCEIASASPSIS